MPRNRLDDVLSDCANGALPPNVALMRMAMLATCKAEIDAALAAARHGTEDAEAQARLDHALALWRNTPGAFDYVKAAIAAIVHDVKANICAWQAGFDRLAAIAPAAGMALYALGRDDLLDLATAEIVHRLQAWHLLRPGIGVLDLGCGGGRMLEALAPKVGQVVGADISAGMLAAARQRCAGIANVRLQLCSGADLSLFGDRCFDLVLAVDVFPYLHLTDAGLAAKLVAEGARVLVPGGSLLIFNFSYTGSTDAHRRAVASLAADAELEVCRNGTRDLDLWDGPTFHLRKPM